MQADTTSSNAPATRSHGCRQSPILIFRCLPTARIRSRKPLLADGGFSAVVGVTRIRGRRSRARSGLNGARQGTAAHADAVMAPDPIMAAQRPSFPAMSVVALPDITE